MSIPLIEPVVKAVRNWADIGPRSEAGAEGPIKRKRLSFDEQYPRISNPIRLNDQQRLDLMPRLGFVSVLTNELDLALSRTPADTEYTSVANVVNAVIRSWREEHPNHSDAG